MITENCFTKNETIELMLENTARELRVIAAHIKEFKLSYKETVKLLNEIADEQEAQSVVVNIRDKI